MSSYIFVPRMEEVLSGRLHLRYSSSNDTYYRDRQDVLTPDSVISYPGWKSRTFESDKVQRKCNRTANEVGLDRESGTYHGRLSWKFDFTSCGLVIDYIILKIDSYEIGGGQVSINLLGNGGNKYIPYMEGESYTNLKGLEGSTLMALSIDLFGESDMQISRLFNQSVVESQDIYPFDLTIRLKRPDFTIGRSLILLGLMFSNKQDTEFSRRRLSRSIRPTGAGFLHIHVNQAKRLPHRISGSLPDPQVKCILQEGDKKITCKTRKLKKTANPIWNESLSMEGISREDLKGQLFDVLIYHFTLGITKKRELLGRVTIGWGTDRFLRNSGSLDFPDDKEEQEIETVKDETIKCDEKEEILNNSDNSTQSNICNDGENDFKDTSSSLDNQANTKLSNSMPSLNGMSSTSVIEYSVPSLLKETKTDGSNKDYLLKRKSLAKLFGFGAQKHKQCYGVHPTIIVSNSTESVVILKSRGLSDCQVKERRPSKTAALSRKARSLSNLLNSSSEEDDFYRRRETLSPCLQSETGWANLLEADYLTKSAVALAARQWRRVYNEPEEWVYCWHPIF